MEQDTKYSNCCILGDTQTPPFRSMRPKQGGYTADFRSPQAVFHDVTVLLWCQTIAAVEGNETGCKFIGPKRCIFYFRYPRHSTQCPNRSYALFPNGPIIDFCLDRSIQRGSQHPAVSITLLSRARSDTYIDNMSGDIDLLAWLLRGLHCDCVLSKNNGGHHLDNLIQLHLLCHDLVRNVLQLELRHIQIIDPSWLPCLGVVWAV